MRLSRVLLLYLLAFPLGAENTGDPEAASLMAAASERNTLLSPQTQPWHLQASYQTFDEAGKPKEKGDFEEFWIGSKKDRISYTSPSFTQTDYLLGTQRLRTGMSQWPPLAEQLVRHTLVHPMPSPGALAGATLTKEPKHIAGALLSCVTVTVPVSKHPAEPAPMPARPLYCFASDSEHDAPFLRFASSAGSSFETSFDDPIEFDRHSVARELHIVHEGKPFLNIHVETLEPLQQSQNGSFTPPPDASEALPQRIRISAAAAQGLLLEGVPPIYPLLSEHAGTQGTVILEIVIGVNGRLREATVLSTPSKDLGVAAIDAVRRWTYKPYLLSGEPVQVLTEVKMAFHLAGK